MRVGAERATRTTKTGRAIDVSSECRARWESAVHSFGGPRLSKLRSPLSACRRSDPWPGRCVGNPKNLSDAHRTRRSAWRPWGGTNDERAARGLAPPEVHSYPPGDLRKDPGQAEASTGPCRSDSGCPRGRIERRNPGCMKIIAETKEILRYQRKSLRNELNRGSPSRMQTYPCMADSPRDPRSHAPCDTGRHFGGLSKSARQPALSRKAGSNHAARTIGIRYLLRVGVPRVLPNDSRRDCTLSAKSGLEAACARAPEHSLCEFGPPWRGHLFASQRALPRGTSGKLSGDFSRSSLPSSRGGASFPSCAQFAR